MTDDVIVYQSCSRNNYVKPLETGSKDELSWEWNYYEKFAQNDSWKNIGNCYFLSWKFSWDQEKMIKKGIYGFEGHITVWNIKQRQLDTSSFRFKVRLTKSGQLISRLIGTVAELGYSAEKPNTRTFQFNLELKQITKLSEYLPYSDPADAVLVVEGQKISVNRNHLSFCSDYFNTLFNSDFKEKSMDEIPIEGVNYEDFRCLLNVIHPRNPISLSDENLEILLELADRFMMPAVTRRVEQHLLSIFDTPFAKVLKWADKYKLDELLDQCLRMLTTADRVKAFKQTFDSLELSDSTNLKLLKIVMKTFK